MTPEQRQRLREVCGEVMGVDPSEIEAETDFFEDLNVDRDDLADLFVVVEDTFDVDLEDGMRRVRTFEDLENLVDDLIPS
jgi:acyl carrier protein